MSIEYKIDDKISVSGKYIGVIKYVGQIKDKEGIWIGIKLDKKNGHNDGTVNGEKYFECEENYGIFIKSERLQKSSRRLNYEEIKHLEGTMNVSLLEDTESKTKNELFDDFSKMTLLKNLNTEKSEMEILREKYENLKKSNNIQKTYYLSKIGSYKKNLINLKQEFSKFKDSKPLNEKIERNLKESENLIKESEKGLVEVNNLREELKKTIEMKKSVGSKTKMNLQDKDLQSYSKISGLLKIIINKCANRKNVEIEMEEYKKLLNAEGIQFEIPKSYKDFLDQSRNQEIYK